MVHVNFSFERLEKYANNSCVIWKESPMKQKVYLYRDVINAAKILSSLLDNLEVLEQDKVLVNIGHSPVLLPIILCLLNKSCCYCPVSIDDDQLENYLTLYQAKYLISGKNIGLNFKSLKTTKVFQFEIYIYVFENEIVRNECPYDILCYAMQTSGSTGQAKVVNVPYGCIMPNITSLSQIFAVRSEDIIFVSSPATFDPFIVDVFLALENGAALLFVPLALRLATNLLAKLIFKANINNATICQMTPSLFRRFDSKLLKECVFHESSSLRILVLGGEPFPGGEFQKWPVWCTSNTVRIFNIYGITEVSCWSSIEEIFKDKTDISVGQPLDDDTKFVVRSIEHPFEIISTGIGELYIECMRRTCLLGSESPKQLLNNKIVSRRTGDLVEIANNKIFYRSRTNAITKRLGCKINLTKIACKMKKVLEGVVDVCCVISSKNSLVIAFVLLSEDSIEPDTHSLFENLEKVEIPDDVVFLHRFPLTKNGKVAKKKLLEYYQSLKKHKRENKQSIVEIFRVKLEQYLTTHMPNGSPPLPEKRRRTHSLEDLSFLDAGGTSFIALHLISELEETTLKSFSDILVKLLDRTCPLRSILAQLNESAREMQKIPTQTDSCDSKQLQLTIAWKFDFQKCVDASPTILAMEENKTIVAVGSHSHKLACLNFSEGSPVSSIHLPDRIESQITITGEYGIVGCYDGFLYKFNIITGEIVKKFNSKGMIKCRPLVVENFIIFGNYSEAENIFCLHSENMEECWSSKVADKSFFASPIELDKNTVIVCSLDGLIANIEYRTGRIVWKHQLQSPIFSTPVALLPNKLIVAEVSGKIHCLQDGINICTYELKAPIFSSISLISTDTVIFGCYDYSIYCLQCNDNNQTFKFNWKIEMNAQVFSTPTSFVYNKCTYVIVCTTKGQINLIDTESQCIVGSIQLDGEVFSSPSVQNNRICVGCRDNFLYCIDISESGNNKVSP